MSMITAVGHNDEEITIPVAEIDSFAESLQGELIAPGNGQYDEHRSIWNGMIDAKPAMIVRCQSAEDVVAAVKFAGRHGLLTSTRSGGHHVAGKAICDNGLVIDMAEMNDVEVDAERKIVRVAGGATLGDIDAATVPLGLATPLGVVSATGVAGLTLHGGFGFQSRKRGLALDNLHAAEVVTADGTLRRASAEENSDLFWALRGGGGNFGVVTAFEFKLYPIPEKVWSLLTLYPAEVGREALEFFRKHYPSTPDEFMAIGVYWSAPNEDFIPEQYRGQPIFAFFGAYIGAPEEGEQVLKPFREFAEPIFDMSEAKPFTEVQRTLDGDYPDGRNYYWKSVYLRDLNDQVLEILDKYAKSRPSPLNSVDIWGLGGEVNRVPADATAFHERTAPFMIGIEANWLAAKDNDANITWARGITDDLMKVADSSSYLNFPGFAEEGEDMLARAYGKNYSRLKQIKTKYDPDNFFRGALNIKPNPK